MTAHGPRTPPDPYVFCCGRLLVFKPFDAAWCVTCRRCGRDFAYAEDAILTPGLLMVSEEEVLR